MTAVKKGDKVKIEYIGKFKDGSVFDSSEGRPPLCFEVGAGQVVPGFDKNIVGLELNEEKTFTILPEDSYGEIRAELIQEIPRDKLPPKPEPQVGMMLVMKSLHGQQIPARITKVNESKVTIDINHPLAGKELAFTVKVVGINEPERTNDKKENEDSCDDCSSCPGCEHGH